MYNQSGKYNTSKVNLLDTAIKSAAISLKTDKDNEYKDLNTTYIENGSKKYFNLCLVLLKDSLNYDKSAHFYDLYKKTLTITKPDFSFKEKDLEFYNGTGAIYVDLYLKNKNKKELSRYCKTSIIEVLRN